MPKGVLLVGPPGTGKTLFARAAAGEYERKLVAYHEAGHAMNGALLPNADPIHKVTIVPHGRVIGVTQQMPDQEICIYPKEYIHDRMKIGVIAKTKTGQQGTRAGSGFVPGATVESASAGVSAAFDVQLKE